MFPIIKNIDNVTKHLEGIDSFNVMCKDSYTVIDYMYEDSDTFSDLDSYGGAVRLECRGIAFDRKGNIIRRGLHRLN